MDPHYGNYSSGAPSTDPSLYTWDSPMMSEASPEQEEINNLAQNALSNIQSQGAPNSRRSQRNSVEKLKNTTATKRQKADSIVEPENLFEHISQEIKLTEADVKKYAENEPQKLEDFLLLSKQNPLVHSFVKNCLIKCFYDDEDLFIRYLVLPRSFLGVWVKSFPLLEKVWDEALEQLKKREDANVDQYSKICKKIFSYIKQNPIIDEQTQLQIKKVLIVLFPQRRLSELFTDQWRDPVSWERKHDPYVDMSFMSYFMRSERLPPYLTKFLASFNNSLPQLIEEFCQAWSSFKPIQEPDFSNYDKRMFIQLLTFSLCFRRSPVVETLLDHLKELHNFDYDGKKKFTESLKFSLSFHSSPVEGSLLDPLENSEEKMSTHYGNYNSPAPNSTSSIHTHSQDSPMSEASSHREIVLSTIAFLAKKSQGAPNPVRDPVKNLENPSPTKRQKASSSVEPKELFKHISDEIKLIEVNVKKYAEEEPKRLEDFLLLSDQNPIASSLLKNCLIKCFLEDADLFTRYLVIPSHFSYPLRNVWKDPFRLLQKDWEDALEQFRKKEEAYVDQHSKLCKKIFSYIEQNSPINDNDIKFQIEDVLSVLLPEPSYFMKPETAPPYHQRFLANFNHSFPQFIEEFCQAWSLIEPSKLPGFRDDHNGIKKKEFIELLKYSLTLNKSSVVESLVVSFQKYLDGWMERSSLHSGPHTCNSW